MAESTLTLSYTDLIEMVGRYLGYGGSSSNWSTDQTNRVDDLIQTGIRQFYYPPPPFAGHRWTFLHPVTSITGWATASGSRQPSWPCCWRSITRCVRGLCVYVQILCVTPSRFPSHTK